MTAAGKDQDGEEQESNESDQELESVKSDHGTPMLFLHCSFLVLF